MRILEAAATAALLAALGLPAIAGLTPAGSASGQIPSHAGSGMNLQVGNAHPSARVANARISPDGPARAPVSTSTAPASPTTRRTTAISTDPVAGAAVGVTASRAFVWPLSPRPTVVGRFVQPQSQWSSGHRGVDLSAALGQPVLSAGDGVVAFAGVIAGRGVITVRHTGGLRTTYEPVDQRLASGTAVRRGDPIGVISPAHGHCVPRTCLHWGALSGRAYRDPLSLLGLGRPVLLPLG